ncbi:uncharacterized protein LOC128042519 [Gossypium raimondii]|uniref:uncharacterized protein LOC128042519 n=1 Tax=Gossypium raimondii TaxID=29730 RepID=UPI00227CFF50|nr:uncharacterized protein LOC128042519 [Gossypium raimondii]
MVEYWLEVTESIMNDIDYTLEQKLKGAVFLLRDEVYSWWLLVEEGEVCGASYVDARRHEFMNLTQCDRSVVEYEAEFLRLSRYARGMVASEYEKCVCFEDNLRDNLRVLIAPQREREFSVLVDKAKITDEVSGWSAKIRIVREARIREIQSLFNSVQRPKKRARLEGPVRVGVPVAPTRIQPCDDCGRRHPRECWRRLGACLRCGSLEHHSRECPQRADQMQASEPDIGSTHSYVASTVSENLGISIECTSSKVTVLSLLGQSVRVSRVYRNVPLEVQGVVFLANLMELPFAEFDLILGMDWSVVHRVSLDHTTKRVFLRIMDDKEVVVIGEHQDCLSNVISAFMAEKWVRKGCETFMAFVSVSVSRDFSVGDIGTVRELTDVFPKELTGLPLNREVEFGIELLPSTTPISIAPYRMAPKELTELKAQFQELLDHGFICPSVSPWGHQFCL